MNSSDKQQKMLEINVHQKKFYNDVVDYATPPKKSNFITLLWWRLRDLQQNYRNDLQIQNEIHTLHTKWLGNLASCNVLDLGCYKGNFLSLYIAENSNSYLGIDLSEAGISILSDTLKNNNLSNSEAIAADFLSAEFQEKYKGKFDVIYANGVAHHFEYFDVFLKNLHNILSENGRVIMLDPMQTPTLLRIARYLYRPFQSDKDWEWPFDKKNFDEIQSVFTINNIQGIMGRAKWGMFLYFISHKLGISVGKKWHRYDIEYANTISPDLWSCMQVVMCIEKK